MASDEGFNSNSGFRSATLAVRPLGPGPAMLLWRDGGAQRFLSDTAHVDRGWVSRKGLQARIGEAPKVDTKPEFGSPEVDTKQLSYWGQET